MQTAVLSSLGAIFAALFAAGPALATPGPAGESPPSSSAPASQPELTNALAEVAVDEKPLTQSALRARVARRAADLVRTARNGEPDDALVAAEFILARQIEPALSREILNIATAEDRQLVAERTTAAAALLDAAAKNLESARDNHATEDLRDRVARARAFAAVFVAIAAAETPPRATAPADPASDRLLQACRGLAGYVDAADTQLAASARLWQAAAYRRAGRPDRALQVLPRVRTTARAMPYDYFSRLERCRALMDRGEFVAAAALSLQIGEEIDNWVAEDQREPARRANLALRADALRRWSDDLKAAGKTEAAADVTRDAESVDSQAAHTPGKGLIRLELSFGGVNAPLSDNQAPARFMDIECNDAAVAVVIDPSALRSDPWPEIQRAIAAFLRSLAQNQTFVIVSTRGTAVTTYPDGHVASGGKPETASRAEQFLTRLAAGRAEADKGGDAMLHALELRPRHVFLITAKPFDDALLHDLARLLHDTPARLSVIWLGGENNGGLEKLAGETGGEFRRPAPASRPADDEPADDPAP